MALLSTPLLRLHGWVALCVLWLAGSLCAAATPTRWQPPVNSLLSIIFTNVPKQLPDLLAVVGEADLVELDAFDTSAATIAALHDRGLKVLCYVNFGALETWRADARQFPADAPQSLFSSHHFAVCQKAEYVLGWPLVSHSL